ncbi:MAG: hypothetical protein AAGB11_03530 [Pseudomonadota bacterium]
MNYRTFDTEYGPVFLEVDKEELRLGEEAAQLAEKNVYADAQSKGVEPLARASDASTKSKTGKRLDEALDSLKAYASTVQMLSVAWVSHLPTCP